MISAEFTINGVANPAVHAVDYDSTVELELLSYIGATSIVWSIESCSDPSEAIPTLTIYGTPEGRNASFVMPSDSSDGYGRSFLIKCTVSSELIGSDGLRFSSVKYGVVGALNERSLLPIAPGEENYRHGTHGWGPEINIALKNSGAGGGGGSGDVTGPVSSVNNNIVTFNGTTGKSIKDSGESLSNLIHRDGSVVFTANQSMGSNKITTLANGTVSSDAINKGQLDSATSAISSIATDRLLGRDAAGTGAVEPITVSGGLEFTGSAGIQRSAISGDITIAAGSNTSAITAGVIVDADVNASAGIAHTKLANMATDSLLGRDTASTGAVETIGLNATLSMTGSGSLQRAALTGDVTAAAGSNTTAIAAGVIVDADVNASANIAHTKLASIATDRILGRDAAGTGALEAPTVSGGVEFSGSGGIQRGAISGDVTVAAGATTATVTDLTIASEVQGSVLYFNGTNWVQLSPGTDGYALTTHGAAQNPTWTDIAAVGSPPTGAAGGDLTGTYPNPSIATGVIVNADVNAAAAIAGTKIAPNFGSQSIVTTGSLSLGTNPANAGGIRIANNFSVVARNAANTANISLLTVDGSNVVRIGDVGYEVSLGSGADTGAVFSPATDTITFTTAGTTRAVIGNGYQSLGTTPAQSGLLRLPNNQSIKARNSANSADVELMYLSTVDRLTIGAAATAGHDYNIAAAGNFQWLENGTSLAILQSNVLELRNTVNQFRFDFAVTSPSFIHETDPNDSITGDTLLIRAQNASGTNSTGGNLDIRSGTGTTSSGTFDMRIGDTRFLQYPGNVIPATSGVLRGYHNSSMITGRDNANANDRYGVRWGAATDTWSFGDSIVQTRLLGSTVRIGTAAQIEATDLGGRDMVSLFSDTAITTTQMPANTGDHVLYWADATTMPTTGFPNSGGILGVDTNLGLEWKGKNGVETTIAQHGDSGNTTKRRMVGWKSQPLRTTLTDLTTTTVASFDVASLNGTAVTNGYFKIIGHYISVGSAYASCGEYMAYLAVGSGTPSVGATQNGNGRYAGVMNGGALDLIEVDVSGTTVRLRMRAHAAALDVQVFAFFEVMEFEP